MVFFVVPIPGKVVDAATNRTTQLYNSYKKPPPATSLAEENEQQNEKGEGPSTSPQAWQTAPQPSQSSQPARSPPAAPGRRAPPPMRSSAPAAPPSRGQPAARAYTAHSPASAAPAPPPMTNENEATTVFGMQLVAHTLDSISLLETMGVITSQAAASIRSQLPDPAQPQAREATEPSFPIPVQVAAAAQRAQPAPPRRKSTATEIRGTALWDYGSNGDPDDLAFSAGDTVIVDEEVNGDWCRGRTIPAGSSEPLPHRGLFPANYIERH